jgi:uncharacterized protein
MASLTNDPLPTNAPPSFHLLAKPSGSTCNIDCTYCFFLSKDALYPNEKHRMSDASLETYIRQLLESHPAPTVTVAWQGGEPTCDRAPQSPFSELSLSPDRAGLGVRQ